MHTKALDKMDPKAPEWISEHCFEVLLWIITQLRQYYHLVDRNEKFFEKEIDDFVQLEVSTVCFYVYLSSSGIFS